MAARELEYLKLAWVQILSKIKSHKRFVPKKVIDLGAFSFECDANDIIMFWEKNFGMVRRNKLSGNIAGFEVYPSLTVTELSRQQTLGSRLLEKAGQYPGYPRVTSGWDSRGQLEGMRVELDVLTSVVYPRSNDYWGCSVDLILEGSNNLPLQITDGVDLFGMRIRMNINPREMIEQIVIKSRLSDFASECGVRIEL